MAVWKLIYAPNVNRGENQLKTSYVQKVYYIIYFSEIMKLNVCL